MREVAKYCIIDALSYQRLMVKYNAINEYREVASVAFLSLFDAHYFAGGMKVCNLLSASIWQRGILTSMISRQQTETRKYPGAHVFPPVKGLKNRRLHNNISEEKGLYTIVLEYLSGKRNEMKKRLAPLKEKNEDIDLVISLMEKHEFIAEYDSICFDCFYLLDAKQYALKVYMNIFYGTAGNICPEERFQRCDEAYDISNGISKEEYWSQMVKISMVEMEKLCDKVNVFLKEDNGSSYLKMAYEEVLFLVVFTGKKKYYVIPHESKPNFNKKPFIHQEIFLGDIYRWIGHMIYIDNNQTRRVVSMWVNDNKLSEFN
ncbi:hypothetical protein RclHR1_01300002 [Rhizophagus clarus]|uniref:DNA-directed DNA polymerase n=1 Tax=Rhizophagus clarus TaxID=94130 RepID=A0A2Z6Q8Z4_9GLOM|nr:hypothetical protein RclHR1_01300002 [Rhizophagus clarus]